MLDTGMLSKSHAVDLKRLDQVGKYGNNIVNTLDR